MDQALAKQTLRKSLRKARAKHVAEQPSAFRALLFNRPPTPLLARFNKDAVIGLYHSARGEAPTSAYACFFAVAGHTLALPHFASSDAPMTFCKHSDPFGESDLAPGPFGLLQPSADAAPVIPDILFVPLIGFTAELDRLGQGGGHYDRWLAEHPGAMTIGLAWDVQLVDDLPTQPHDIAMDAVVTPTRMYGLD